MSEALDRVRAADAALAGPDHVPLGRRAPLVAGGWAAMEPDDWVFPGRRERVGAVLRGAAPEDLRGTAPLPGLRVGGSSGVPGQRALHAAGAAWASGRPALCFVGPASAAAGPFHEALNLVALRALPVVFLLADPVLDERAPVAPHLGFDPEALAAAHGLGYRGADLDEAAVREAVAAARDRGGLVHVRIPAPNTNQG